MEHTTKFDLNQNIQAWKNTLAKKSGIEQEDIVELESHLLDEMEKLRQKDLNKEESFFVAQKRLGTIENLNREYEKLNQNTLSISKLELVLKGILLLFVFMAGIQFLTNLSLLFGTFFELNYTSIITINIILLVFIPIASIFYFYRIISGKKHGFKKFNTIPILIGLVIILNLLNISYQQSVYQQMEFLLLGNLRLHLEIFKIICGIVLVMISYIVHTKVKQQYASNILVQ